MTEGSPIDSAAETGQPAMSEGTQITTLATINRERAWLEDKIEIHRALARNWTFTNFLLGGLLVALAAFAGVTASSQFPNHATYSTVAAAVVAVLSAVNSFLSPNNTATSHARTSNRFLQLAKEFEIRLLQASSDRKTMVDTLEWLIRHETEILASSPVIVLFFRLRRKRKTKSKVLAVCFDPMQLRLSR
jgi:hypothetical protein